MIGRVFVAGVLGISISTGSLAYELLTHGRLSEIAVGASVLARNPEVMADMALKPLGEQKFVVGGENRTVVDIIGFGARDEDDFPRPISHFFDPSRANSFNQGGARIGFTPIGIASPSWALEDRELIEGQDDSFTDARSFQRDALTKASKADREASFVRMFRSLGMVGHHLQDMTQPQHVRNDLHCISELCRPVFLHNPSAFEEYTEAKFSGGYTPEAQPSVYTDANVAVFMTPRSFWLTGDGKGIAEFTHRNFVSAGTNFRYEGGAVLADAKYGYPLPQASSVDPVTIQEAYGARPIPAEIVQYCAGRDCRIEFFATTGVDTLTGESIVNPKASSLSIFDQDLQLRSVQFPWSDGEGTTSTRRVFSLNSLNFDEAHKYLLKRAVGYSAGLIDYFFRGRIDYGRDPADPARRVISNLGTEPMTGVFALYYDTDDETRKEVRDDLGNPVSWDTRVLLASANGQLAPGATLPADATFAPPADAKESGVYLLVFQGDMGEEKAVSTQGIPGAVVSKLIRAPRPQVSAGAGFSLVIRSDSTLLAFGENSSGQVGNGRYSVFPELGIAVPYAVAGVDNLVSVAGGHHTLALRKDGSMLVWGNNRFGELGLGFTNPDAFNLPQPMTVPGPGKVVAVAAGWSSSYALKDDGSLWAWGENSRGQVGDGTFVNRSTPVKVMGAVAALAKGGGNSHMLVLKTDGSVWAWGLNNSGQLGDSTITSTAPFSKSTPVRVLGLPTDVVALAAGGGRSLALTRSGTVYAWGSNGSGSLGVGSAGQFVATAIPVPNLTGVKAIAAGDNHTLAVLADGTVWAWGENWVGQLGNGQFTPVATVPAKVEGPSGVIDIAAGELHSLAMQADGKLWTWGYNFRGQLGDGTFIEDDPFGRAVPMIVFDEAD